ncbi:hypothetical protein NPA13_02470 [Mycoplasma sp. 2045]|uniref:DNA polymerase III subunit delta n=1 Tax=Mycoplasma sp. 2045 TaxID=2967301 RepID=UPI00211B8483|nr:hypothetical protein [Mycoplasma sp. 2045]UUM20302.1 hypothetical protein NPA13_02470 [Mycoplasma sp. 2045]
MKLYYGTDLEYIKSIIKSEEKAVLERDIFIFDNNSYLSSFDTLNEILLSNGLFSSSKLIILENISFSKATKSKDNSKNEYLLNLLKSVDSNISVYLIYKTEIINKRVISDDALKLCEKPKKIAALLPTQLADYVISEFAKNNIAIDKTTSLVFLQKLPNDWKIINNEINKLCLLNKTITEDIIEQTIAPYPSDDPFQFSNAISRDDFQAMYKIFEQKKNENTPVILLFANFVSTFTLVNRIYWYQSLGLNISEISQALNMNEKRVFVHVMILKRFGFDRVQKIIEQLAKTDKLLKTSGVDSYDIFEMFMIQNFAKNK